jgi:hypothetical protein
MLSWNRPYERTRQKQFAPLNPRDHVSFLRRKLVLCQLLAQGLCSKKVLKSLLDARKRRRNLNVSSYVEEMASFALTQNFENQTLKTPLKTPLYLKNPFKPLLALPLANAQPQPVPSPNPVAALKMTSKC